MLSGISGAFLFSKRIGGSGMTAHRAAGPALPLGANVGTSHSWKPEMEPF